MTNIYSEEDYERCTLSGRREILFQLRSLIKHKQRLFISFDEGRQSFLTVLIDLSEENNSLYFDIGGSEEINRAIVDVKHVAESTNKLTNELNTTVAELSHLAEQLKRLSQS